MDTVIRIETISLFHTAVENLRQEYNLRLCIDYTAMLPDAGQVNIICGSTDRKIICGEFIAVGIMPKVVTVLG